MLLEDILHGFHARLRPVKDAQQLARVHALYGPGVLAWQVFIPDFLGWFPGVPGYVDFDHPAL
ncbi:hypothetical protein ABZT51_51100 [Streptomyces sp. NPDC005373]|uniref:hypothetical protein n=1 Tax=Streptomyces sp. NPDC005373 TaxID=3156879 RepID=UPI0033B5CCC4